MKGTQVPEEFDLSMKFGEAEFSASGPSELVLDAFEEFKSLIEKVPASATQGAGDRSAATALGEKPPFAVFMKRPWPNQGANAVPTLRQRGNQTFSQIAGAAGNKDVAHGETCLLRYFKSYCEESGSLIFRWFESFSANHSFGPVARVYNILSDRRIGPRLRLVALHFSKFGLRDYKWHVSC